MGRADAIRALWASASGQLSAATGAKPCPTSSGAVRPPGAWADDEPVGSLLPDGQPGRPVQGGCLIRQMSMNSESANWFSPKMRRFARHELIHRPGDIRRRRRYTTYGGSSRRLDRRVPENRDGRGRDHLFHLPWPPPGPRGKATVSGMAQAVPGTRTTDSGFRLRAPARRARSSERAGRFLLRHVGITGWALRPWSLMAFRDCSGPCVFRACTLPSTNAIIYIPDLHLRAAGHPPRDSPSRQVMPLLVIKLEKPLRGGADLAALWGR